VSRRSRRLLDICGGDGDAHALIQLTAGDVRGIVLETAAGRVTWV
jgi:hypothetical protein